MSHTPVPSDAAAAPWPARATERPGGSGGHRGPLVVSDDFGVLDDPVEQADFTQALASTDGPACVSTLVVQGMYCAACADTVESALLGLPGVVGAQVHAATRRLTLRWDPAQTRLSALARAVGQAGYRLLPMQQALGLEARLKETRQALWRLFVAGFCMMQVMMYAWPAYITEPGDIPADITQLLRWASWILSLPVVFFASGPFLSGAWRDLRRGRVGMDTPVSIGILVTFGVSTAATFDPTGPWGGEVWFDSLTMFVFFLLGGRYLEFKARDRTAGALDALMNRLPERCERRSADGRVDNVSLKRLQVGDEVRVQAGQAFPGDATVLEAFVTVDESLLTGESRPITRGAGQAVVAGSYNLSGPAWVRLERLGRDTRFAQIVSLMERASTEKPRLAQLADRIAAPFLGAVLLAALVVLVSGWSSDPHRALSVAVAVLIVTCPCALSLATPAAMLSAAGALARRGVLVRRLQAFEALAGVDTVVFDKTGTLTHNRLTLQAVHTRPGVDRATALAWAQPLAVGSLHPVSAALARACAPAHVPTAAAVPAGAVLREVAGGGMEMGHPGGWVWRLGSAAFTGLDPAQVDPAGGGPVTHLVDHEGWVATFVFDEGVRSDAAEVVARLRAAGLAVHLLSGDQAAAAARVAHSVGITHVVSQASPEHKLAEVVRLQGQGARLAMVGDGLNDGPVLARADTSFAMGTAAPLAQAQADFVVQSGRLSEVLDTLLLARRTLRTVRQNLVWAAAYNAVCVPLALLGWMPPWLAGLGMATSSLLVVGNALRLARHAPTTGSAGAPHLDEPWKFSTS